MRKGAHGFKAGAKGLKAHRGLKPPKPPMGSAMPNAAPTPGNNANSVKLAPPKDLTPFAHKVPTMKTLPLTTDRGAFKMKV